MRKVKAALLSCALFSLSLNGILPAHAANLIITVDPNTYSGSGNVTDSTSNLVGTPTSVTYESNTNCGAFVFSYGSKIAFNQYDFGNTFSISAWVRPTSDAYSIQTLFSNAGANQATTGFKTFWNNWNSSDHNMVIEYGDGGAGSASGSSSAPVAIDSWQHLVYTINRSTGAMALYRNGSAVTIGAGTFKSGANMNQQWWLGAMGGSSYYMNAKLGVVKIYSTVLSASEVTSDYNSTSARYAATPTCPVPAAPTNSVSPSISGTTAYASTLTAGNGTWTSNPTSFTYQWSSAATAGGSYSNISGATAQTYSPTTSDIGRYLKVAVTATNAGGSNSATSSNVGPIMQASQAALSFTQSVSTKTYPYSQSLTFTPSGGSGTGAVTYAIASGGTASGCSLSSSNSPSTLTATSNGTCLIQATRAADTNYLAATSSNVTFTFTRATPGTLTLTSTTGSYGTPLTLLTSGGQSSAIDTFSVTSGPCSVSGSTLTASSHGTCMVTGYRAADSNYAATNTVSTAVTIAKGKPVVTQSVPTTSGFRTPTPITLSTGVAGKVRFTQNGKNIPGCQSIPSNASNGYTATCSWKPTLHGIVKIAAIFTASDSSYSVVSSIENSVIPSRRTGYR